MGKKLVQFVGVIVDSRNEIACLVLIEEGERQLLQLSEQGVAQLEKNRAADSAHRKRLIVACEKSAKVYTQENRSRHQDAGEIPFLNVCVDRSPNDDRPNKRRAVSNQHRDERQCDESFLIRQERSQTLERGSDSGGLLLLAARVKRVVRGGLCCAASHRFARIPAKSRNPTIYDSKDAPPSPSSRCP